MMMVDADGIIRRYADSLYEVAKEKNMENEIFNQVNLVLKVMNDNHQFIKILEVPTISKLDKYNIMFDVFNKYVNIFILNFIRIIIDNSRVNLIVDILNQYNDIYYESNGIKKVDIITAVEVKAEEKDDILEKCERVLGKKVIPNYLVDKEIIGGIIFKSNDSFFDLSVKSKLEDMKKLISETII